MPFITHFTKVPFWKLGRVLSWGPWEFSTGRLLVGPPLCTLFLHCRILTKLLESNQLPSLSPISSDGRPIVVVVVVVVVVLLVDLVAWNWRKAVEEGSVVRSMVDNVSRRGRRVAGLAWP